MSLIADKYHLLKSPLPGEWIDKLLGRVVLDKENPTAVLAPDRDGPKNGDEASKGSYIPQNIVPDLADPLVPYTSLHHLLSEAKDVDARLSLTQYFKTTATRKRSTLVTINGIEVERYDMSSIPTKLEDLMENTYYAQSVKKLLKGGDGNRSLGMVTGIFVSKSLTIVEEASKETGVGAETTVPISKIIGEPTNITDVSAGAKYNHAKQKEGEVKIEARSVFAVAYTDVKLTPIESKVEPVQLPSKRSLRHPFRIQSKKRRISPEQEYNVEMDISTGANIYHGSPSSHSGSDDDGNTTPGARSTTSTRVEETEEYTTFKTPDSLI